MAGEASGKYLDPVLADTLAMLTAHGELHRVKQRLSDAVEAELMVMSSATIDRYLDPTRDRRDRLRGKATTRPGNTLRESGVNP